MSAAAQTPQSPVTDTRRQPMTLRVELRQAVGGYQLSPFTVRASPAPLSLSALSLLLRERIVHELGRSCAGDGGESDDCSAKGLELAADSLELAVELYDPRRQQFAPLLDVEELLAHARRARLSVAVLNAHEAFPDEDHTHLALPGRMFDVDPERFSIDGRRVFVGEVGNSGQGTGLTTWDGSVVLAKFLEHQSREGGVSLRGARVLELGAGTGLVGLSAALLGARDVLLTDLSYTMENLARNVATTLRLAADAQRAVSGSVSTRVLDWFDPPTDLGSVDLILASDVVWVEELIAPLVNTMSALLGQSHSGARVLMAHQTRSTQSDRVLFTELERHALRVRRIPDEELHPSFVSDRIFLLEIDRVSRRQHPAAGGSAELVEVAEGHH